MVKSNSSPSIPPQNPPHNALTDAECEDEGSLRAERVDLDFLSEVAACEDEGSSGAAPDDLDCLPEVVACEDGGS